MRDILYHMFTLGGMEVWRWVVSHVLFAPTISSLAPSIYPRSVTVLGRVDVGVCLSTGGLHILLRHSCSNYRSDN